MILEQQFTMDDPVTGQRDKIRRPVIGHAATIVRRELTVYRNSANAI
jgi:hypothetical protein